jgi:PAS domain S-box-containing protein
VPRSSAVTPLFGFLLVAVSVLALAILAMRARVRRLESTCRQLAEAQRVAHLGSWEYVAATRSTVWSDEEKRIYGLSPADPSPDYEEMLRRFIHPDDASELDRIFRGAFLNGGAFANENRILRADGTVRWIANNAQPYFDEQGRLVRYIGTTLDITERKKAEEAQEGQRQAALRTEQMAALGALTAGLAHEVRNPLFAISATIDALGAELEARPGVSALLVDAQREVERLNELMKELLDYGKPNVTECSEAPLGTVVDAAMRSCALLAEGAGVDVERAESTAPLVVRLDRRRLEQVIENLLENAIQHAPAGTAVRVDLEGFAEAGRNWARCRVSDAGPGFEPTDVEKVFEPFFTRRPNGTGLGLSIAQQIVEQHGGRIRAGNRPGGGAVLTVEVPCLASLATAEAALDVHARVV